MAAWLLILVAAAALVVVLAITALVWVLSGGGKPGGVIDPHDNAGFGATSGRSERTNIHHNVGDAGPQLLIL